MDTSLWTLLLAFSVVALSEGSRYAAGHRWRDGVDGDSLTKICSNKHHRGCTVQENRCRCYTVTGCQSPWPYMSEEECHEDQKGSLDVCKHYRSCGRGFCVQTKHGGVRRAKCECAGSGYHGMHCQHKCPKVLGRLDADYPEACLLS